MDSTATKTVKKLRKFLTTHLSNSLEKLVLELPPMLGDPEKLNTHLSEAINNLPYCKYIYVLDVTGVQISATVSHDEKNMYSLGRDRSSRPYMKNLFKPREGEDFELSKAYITKNTKRPSITGIQLIRDEQGNRLGFFGVDYDLRELPRDDTIYEEPRQWRQIKGDPAIRSGLFLQQRAESQMDKKLSDVMTILEELMLEHGVYHCQIHYSSSRVTIWHIDDPYTYRILTMDELSDSEICLAYPQRPYFERNIVPKKDICNVFKQFSALRFADETVYLRSGSLNLVNGFTGLNFSCDGTHYLIYDEFLSRGLEFWFGVDNEQVETEESINMTYLDEMLEKVAQRGCLEVNQILGQLDAGKIPELLSELTTDEQKYIHQELATVMAVYDGGVCSV